jgi:hypothetical protein
VESVTCLRCRTVNTAVGEPCEHCGSPLPQQVRTAPPSVAPQQSPPVITPAAEDDDPFAAGPPAAGFSAVGSAGTVVAVLRGPDGRVVPLQPGDRLVVGRTPDSPLARLCNDNISFRHAEIYVDGRSVVVVDTNSTNGTFVDDQRLAPSVPRVLTRSAALRLASDPPLCLTLEVGARA